MWSLFQTARRFSARPSELVHITDPFAAFCFDDAVSYLGMYIESELSRVRGKDERETEQKMKLRLRRLLGPGREKESARFADPVAMGKVTVNKVG